MQDGQRRRFSLKLLVISFVLGTVAIPAAALDRSTHHRRQTAALGELDAMGLNREMGGAHNTAISFYSTGVMIEHAQTAKVIRNLKTLSAEYNGGFRFGYDIDRITFTNCTPKEHLVSELRRAFPGARLEFQKP